MGKPVPPPGIGEQFNRWTVTGKPVWQSPGHRAVPCRCECGTVRQVLVFALRNNRSKSCGCWKAERARTIVAETRWKNSHGMSGHPLYSTWRGMMRRCYNEEDPRFRRWGARGITVFPEWHDIGQFVSWVEEHLGPRGKNMTLDRYPDNDGNYEPGNVRWATPLQQHENATNLGHDPETGCWLSSYDGC